MANTLLTTQKITNRALEIAMNTNAFIGAIDKQYDDSFGVAGAKIGSTLRIRLPNDYTVTSGPAASFQDTVERNTTLTLSQQKHVDVAFTSVDYTLSLDDFTEIVLAPMVNDLMGAVAGDVMSGAEAGTANFTANIDLAATNNVITPTAQTFLLAGAILDNNSSPRGGMGKRSIVLDPLTMARATASLTGLFNPQVKISDQYRKGLLTSDTLGFDFMVDQTVIKHTTGTATGTPAVTVGTVNGAGQATNNLTVNTLAGALNVGDIITIAGVYQANTITKTTVGVLRQFVVTANVAAGATSIPIYPAIIPPTTVSGTTYAVQYQTVMQSPANAATISLVTNSGSVYRKNLAFARDAITMGTADLVLPPRLDAARAASKVDGISLRFIKDWYNPQTDQMFSRLDILYGYTYVRPEWVVAIGDAL
jgi:hypothetical protein